MENEFAQYQISLKILLKKGDSYLFLRDAATGFLDLPGGRINTAEYEVGLGKILNREVIEEIGGNARYKVGAPIFQYRAAKDGTNIFITVYGADYLSGEIALSPDHNDFKWINPKMFDFQKEHFLSEEGFIALKKYLEK